MNVIYQAIQRLAMLGAALILAAPAQAERARVEDTIAQRVQACTACHGKEGRATSAGFFPRIAGKPADYLYNQLTNFRDGRRQYPAMNYLVANLSDAYLREIADYFSEQHPPYPAPQPALGSPALRERGRALVMSGDPARKLPACIACHGEKLAGALPAIPALLGLPRDYLNAQFGAWKTGSRQAAAPDCMAQVSRLLSAEDVEAISSWLAAQPAPDGMRPAAALPAPLPISCGSVRQ